MPRLRVVTYNIAHGRGLQPIQGLSSGRAIRRNLDRIAEMLLAWQPDIVALQEIDQDSSWAGRFDHLAYLQEKTGFPYGAFGVNNTRSGFLCLKYGNALLSRHPLRFAENTVFGTRKIGEKGFLFAEVEVEGMCVPLVNMHLHYRSRTERLQQAQAVMNYLDRLRIERGATWSLAPLLCGDLNNPAHTRDATASFADYFAAHGAYTFYPQRARTFPSLLPRRTLDFIFLPPSCREVFSLVIKSYLSDHRPVLVDCSF